MLHLSHAPDLCAAYASQQQHPAHIFRGSNGSYSLHEWARRGSERSAGVLTGAHPVLCLLLLTVSSCGMWLVAMRAAGRPSRATGHLCWRWLSALTACWPVVTAPGASSCGMGALGRRCGACATCTRCAGDGWVENSRAAAIQAHACTLPKEHYSNLACTSEYNGVCLLVGCGSIDWLAAMAQDGT